MTTYCNNTANAAFGVCLLTLLVSLFKRGLGLMAQYSQEKLPKMQVKQIASPLSNYWSMWLYGLMVWHGSIGSAPVKAAESGHIQTLMTGIYNKQQLTIT